MSIVLESVDTFLREHAHYQRCYIAVSGGVDSMVLLHAVLEVARATQTVYSDKLCVIHVNHQLSPNALEWQALVENFCQDNGVACVSRSVCLATNVSVEVAARTARYQVLADECQAHSLVLMGHHASDQAETLLFRIARGAGLHGLAGIPSIRPFDNVWIGRPLLHVTRNTIERYARKHHLAYAEDDSNQNVAFDRNYLRHEIMPRMRQRWPSFEKKSAQLTSLISDELDLLNSYVSKDLESLNPQENRAGISIDWFKLSLFSKPRLNAVLRYWISQIGLSAPSRSKLDQLVRFFQARADANPQLDDYKGCFRRYKHRLYWVKGMPDDAAKPSKSWCWNPSIDATLCLGNGSFLSARTASAGLDASLTYTVRFRQGGERSHPSFRCRSQTLKKLLQEVELEPWLRDKVPLIYCQGELAAVGDLWIERAFLCDAQRPCFQLSWSL